MKKVGKISMESSPSASSFPIGDEAKKRFKHQILMQDYLDLLKETESKRKKIWMAKQNKLELLAVVKFLRSKFKCMSKNPSKRTPYRLKKQPLTHSSTSIPISKNPLVKSDVPLKAGKHDTKEAAVPSTPVLSDLNQISSANGEEAEEFHVELEPP